MRRRLRRLVNSIGHWGFTLMIVPKRGGVRRVVVPWLGVIAIVAAMGTVCYFIGYYPYAQGRNRSNLARIRCLEAENQRLEKENNQLQPALRRSRQVETLVNRYDAEVAGLRDAFRSVQRKSPQRLTSRGGFRRPPLYRLPEPVVSADDGQISLLATVESNTASLSVELERRLAEIQEFKADLLAYEHLLDHTPNHWPISGRLTSWFGYRRDPLTRYSRMHGGIDLAAKTGSAVRAAAHGTVKAAGYRSGYGWTIVISHGYGYETLYGHNSILLVRAGQIVKKGQLIARSGSSGRSTGPHLHFEIRLYGKRINPLTVLR